MLLDINELRVRAENKDILKGLPGVSPRLVDQRGDALMGALARGLAVPEKELPRFPRGERRVQDAAFDARVRLRNTSSRSGSLVDTSTMPSPAPVTAASTSPAFARSLR